LAGRKPGPPRARLHVVVYALLLAALTTTSPRTLVGDAGEYVAYAIAFSHGRGPSLEPRDFDTIRGDLAAFDPSFERWDIDTHTHAIAPGRSEFVHFWLYSAMAAPFAWAARVVGADPRSAFAVLNGLLLIGAFYVCLRVIWRPLAWLVFAGPILWWADKPHPEALIVAGLTVAFVAWRERPMLAFIAAGVVAAQVPVFVIVIPLLALVVFVDRPGAWRDARTSLRIGAGAAFPALAALYYLARIGRPTLLASAAAFHWPTPAEMSTVLFDLNVGLVPAWPLFAVIVAAAVVAMTRSRSRRGFAPVVAASSIVAAAIVIGGLQIGNLLHGGTPGVIRYAIWLVPCAVPCLVAASSVRWWRWLVAGLVPISVLVSVAIYRPSVEEFSHRPTAISRWAWQHVPAWSTPLAEVFVKSQRQRELPAWTSDCSKVLLVGRGDGAGMWPRPCAPVDIPSWCRQADALCYADRQGRSYAFTPAPGGAADLQFTPEIVWLPAGEPAIRDAMTLVDWWSLAPVDRHQPEHVVDSWEHVRVEYVFESTARDRAFIVMTEAEAGARVTLRLGGQTTGVLLDADTGAVLDRPSTPAGAGELWTLEMPGPRRVVVLALTRNTP